jgi:hypothetical protein
VAKGRTNDKFAILTNIFCFLQNVQLLRQCPVPH